jgi:nicotinamidase-related amidase
MEYDETSTAVVVVDMQRDFCHPDGALYAEGSEDVIPAVNDVLTSTYEAGVTKAFFTQDTHQRGDPEFDEWGEHCLDGSWGHAIHDGIEVDPSVYPVVQKDTYDAFYATDFNTALAQSGIDTLIVCGTLANVCVQETTTSAMLRGYDVAVVSDAVGYIEEAHRENALDHMEFFGAEIIQRGDL